MNGKWKNVTLATNNTRILASKSIKSVSVRERKRNSLSQKVLKGAIANSWFGYFLMDLKVKKIKQSTATF